MQLWCQNWQKGWIPRTPWKTLLDWTVYQRKEPAGSTTFSIRQLTISWISAWKQSRGHRLRTQQRPKAENQPWCQQQSALCQYSIHKIFWILTCVAAKAGIPVIETEESYTSKASLIDKDPIPVYKEGDRLEYHFQGNESPVDSTNQRKVRFWMRMSTAQEISFARCIQMHLMELPTSPTRTKQLFELPEKHSAMRSTRKTRQTTKKTWYEPMAASSQAGTEACIFRTVQSKQCERQDQIYRRIKTNSRKKDGLKVSS